MTFSDSLSHREGRATNALRVRILLPDLLGLPPALWIHPQRQLWRSTASVKAHTTALQARSQLSLDVTLAPRLALDEHRRGQDRTTSALRVRTLERVVER